MNRVVCMYFSPTGTTQKVVEEIGTNLADALNLEKKVENFTLPESRKQMPIFGEGDIIILGTPVIAGRVPNVLLKYLATMDNHGAIGLPVVLFGNRHYDDALIELGDLLIQSGCRLIGGAAFVGEHSFSRVLAKGRPNKEDLKEAAEFGKALAEVIKQGRFLERDLPGKRPYRPYYKPLDKEGRPADIRKVQPKVDVEKCIDCKLCAEVCPMGTIDYDDVTKKINICIKCGACEKICPTGAVYYDDEVYLKHRHELEEELKEPKENITVLP